MYLMVNCESTPYCSSIPNIGTLDHPATRARISNITPLHFHLCMRLLNQVGVHPETVSRAFRPVAPVQARFTTFVFPYTTLPTGSSAAGRHRASNTSSSSSSNRSTPNQGPATLPAARMAPKPAKTVIFKAFVNEGPVPAETFEVQESSVDPDSLQDGELLLQLLYLSVDPYLRMMMKDMKSYRAGLIPGEPMASRAVALVKAAGSKAPGLTEGDVVTGTLPWSTLILLDKDAQAAAGLSKVDPVLLGQVPLSYRLGVLGMPGMKAYTSLKKIAEPKPGEVAFVSAASGAVGLVVGQLLKNVYGCKVIGSAGSGEKVKLLQDVGFDAAFNYKETDTARALKEAAPDGLDIYFENVGGQTLEVVLDQARRHARIVACGMVSQYDLPPEERYGVKNLFQIIGKSIKLQGFIVSDFAEELGAEFAADMTQYVLDGKVRVVEHVTKGIENAGRAFIDMMKGGNVGKAIVQVVDQDPFDVVKG